MRAELVGSVPGADVEAGFFDVVTRCARDPISALAAAIQARTGGAVDVNRL